VGIKKSARTWGGTEDHELEKAGIREAHEKIRIWRVREKR
jgi:hypothetical protein